MKKFQRFSLSLCIPTANINPDHMKPSLSDEDRDQLNRLVAEAEKSTGAEIVLAVIGRCDSYAEIPWKAFALGASLAGLAVVLTTIFSPGWITPAVVIASAGTLLLAGAALALLTIFAPWFARPFLTKHRTTAEVKQYAESLFLSRGLYRTGHRTGVLLLVSLFERRVVLLPDQGLAGRLTAESMQTVIRPMKPLLRQRKLRHALETGLSHLTPLLAASANTSQSDVNELSNRIIEEEGI